MSSEEFEELLKPRELNWIYLAPDGMRLAEAVATPDEKQRKKLSNTAKAFFSKHRQAVYSNNYEFAVLAVLAVCPLSEAKKLNVGMFQRHENAAFKILDDRRPEWVDEWID